MKKKGVNTDLGRLIRANLAPGSPVVLFFLALFSAGGLTQGDVSRIPSTNKFTLKGPSEKNRRERP